MWMLEQVLPVVPNQAVRNSFYQLKDKIIFGLVLKPSAADPAQSDYFEQSYQRLCEGLRRFARGDGSAFCDSFAWVCRYSLDHSRSSLDSAVPGKRPVGYDFPLSFRLNVSYPAKRGGLCLGVTFAEL